MRPKAYRVYHSNQFDLGVTVKTKTEALKIFLEFVKEYEFVTIKTFYHN